MLTFLTIQAKLNRRWSLYGDVNNLSANVATKDIETNKENGDKESNYSIIP